jgi:hypothetical protein
MPTHTLWTGPLAALALMALMAPAFATDEQTTAQQGSDQQYVDRKDAACPNCPERKVYDSQEVIKTTRDVDRSRVINTRSVVTVSRQVRPKNHLVVHDRTVRNVGTIRHNHTIVEKEIRYWRRAPAVPIVVNYVVQEYRTVRQPAQVYSAPIVHSPEPARSNSRPLGSRG